MSHEYLPLIVTLKLMKESYVMSANANLRRVSPVFSPVDQQLLQIDRLQHLDFRRHTVENINIPFKLCCCLSVLFYSSYASRSLS